MYVGITCLGLLVVTVDVGKEHVEVIRIMVLPTFVGDGKAVAADFASAHHVGVSFSGMKKTIEKNSMD